MLSDSLRVNLFIIMVSTMVIVGLILGSLRTRSQAQKIGRIRCRRCHYEGPVKSTKQWGLRWELLCPNCGSGDWERMK